MRLLRLTLLCAAAGPAAAQVPAPRPVASSELREHVERFTTDLGGINRRWGVEYSPARRARQRAYVDEQQQRLDQVAFAPLSQEGRIDWLLLTADLRYRRQLLDREDRLVAEMAPLLPFADTITAFEERRRQMTTPDGRATAAMYVWIAAQADSLRTRWDTPATAPKATRIVAFRAQEYTEQLRTTLAQLHRYYDGYDPRYSWWAKQPYAKADSALRRYVRTLREKGVGWREGQEEPIVGDPIGRQGLLEDLAHEFIPYTPEELIAVAEREFAWCDAEIRKAARAMGFGDDWKAAMERVKESFVPPGDQPDLIRDLAREAIAFVEQRDLVTVPPLSKEIWRMEMMTPEQQRVSPFFLGGEVIRVSYPTDAMEHGDKLMSLRGNNPHFSRATVQHELIPGHHLQGYMTARYNPHRQAFSTPFWGEGWALYWEMLLWDLDFPRSPEDRIGMLFWRMHRCARIVFSLRFHLGEWTPQQAIDYLVDRVNHERANATAEVRRSFNGTYSPLYQAAYMMGGLQFRALHRELVQEGRMTNREFHDRILQGGRMPVEMVRARLMDVPLTATHAPSWRYAGDPLGARR
jgi:hypothetical protein